MNFFFISNLVLTTVTSAKPKLVSIRKKKKKITYFTIRSFSLLTSQTLIKPFNPSPNSISLFFYFQLLLLLFVISSQSIRRRRRIRSRRKANGNFLNRNSNEGRECCQVDRRRSSSALPPSRTTSYRNRSSPGIYINSIYTLPISLLNHQQTLVLFLFLLILLILWLVNSFGVRVHRRMGSTCDHLIRPTSKFSIPSLWLRATLLSLFSKPC